MSSAVEQSVSRREFLRLGAAAFGTGVLGARSFGDVTSSDRTITIGIFTDSHYADRDRRGSRYYRDSTAKLAQFVEAMNEANPSFAIVLGDYVDKGRTLELELGYLKDIETVYRKFRGERRHVMGNHDVATFTKEQFVSGTGMPAPHYSFDSGPFHCVVLDANYRKDFSPYKSGNFKWTETYIPPDEQKWLEADLQGTKRKTIAFIHQTLDDEHGHHGVKNAPDVRKLLESSGKVIAVFQGHNHRGAYRHLNGIHYFTMRAMVEGAGLENNSYALVRVSVDGQVAIKGFAKQVSRNVPAA